MCILKNDHQIIPSLMENDSRGVGKWIPSPKFKILGKWGLHLIIACLMAAIICVGSDRTLKRMKCPLLSLLHSFISRTRLRSELKCPPILEVGQRRSPSSQPNLSPTHTWSDQPLPQRMNNFLTGEIKMCIARLASQPILVDQPLDPT